MKKILALTLFPLLTMTIAGCGNKTNTDSNNSGDSNSPVTTWPEEQQEDIYGVLPEEVKNANVSIDLLVYIEGQQKRLPDIGNFSNDPSKPGYRYYPKDVSAIELSTLFGAANAFKKLCPGVQINLSFCNIDDYPGAVRQYKEANGHLPQLMLGTEHVVQMLAQGYCYDLSRYSDSAYYEQYNDYFISRFNYGGFQAAFPVSASPWGILTNATSLEDYNIISSVIDPNTNLPSQEYKNYINDFTWERFAKTVKDTNDRINDYHAGISKPVEWFVDYSLPSIYDQFISTGTVDFTSEEALAKITRLLEYENEIANNAVYKYGIDPSSNIVYTGNEAYFNGAAGWNGKDNFVVDQYCTFWGEAPWSIGVVSSRVQTLNEEYNEGKTTQEITEKFDVLPFPKFDSNSTAYTGIAIDGYTIGNQCPIGTECTAQKQLEMDVAAYFTMFLTLDPRAIESRANIHYIFNDEDYYGEASFPLCKQGSRFEWQDNPEVSKDDPAKDYADNWQYNMANYLKVYNTYITNDEEPDVVTFRNIMPGLTALLDSVYAHV